MPNFLQASANLTYINPILFYIEAKQYLPKPFSIIKKMLLFSCTKKPLIAERLFDVPCTGIEPVIPP